MGRCYEFGVSIDPTSEHAMVVAPEGGRCVCPRTGAVCHGRFAGCANIVKQPGRVPPNAPDWARPDAVGSPPMATLVGQPAVWVAPSAQPTPTTPTVQPPPAMAAAPSLPVAPTAPPAPQPSLQATAPNPAPSGVGELGDLLEVVQQLKAELVVERSPDTRLADIERSLHQLTTHEASAPAPAPGSIELAEKLNGATSLLQEMTAAHHDAMADFEARTVSLHTTMENLAHMVVLARQETLDAAERQQGELHAVRRQMIELRASIEERIEATAHERLSDELRTVRRLVEDMEAHAPPNVVTASQLAETINTLRDAGTEEISAAHLVHSFQLEIRSLREQLQQLTEARHTQPDLDASRAVSV